MDKEYIEGLAGECAQALVEHEVITEEYKAIAKCTIYMVLHKEMLAPLENVCIKIDTAKHTP